MWFLKVVDNVTARLAIRKIMLLHNITLLLASYTKLQMCAYCYCCFYIFFAQFSSTHTQPINISNKAIFKKPIDRGAYTIYYKNLPPNANGKFAYDFQTSNGITTKAAGNEFGHSGVVQYVSAEGIPITTTYVADANGYHPKGDHIPKLPENVQHQQSQKHKRTVNEKQKKEEIREKMVSFM